MAAGSGLLTLAGGSNLPAVEQYGYATLQSDQPGYHPGQLVTLTGSGWQPGEAVTLTQAQTPSIDGNRTAQLVADANGNIADASYAPSPLDIGTAYTVTAVGSKSHAEIQFTDAAAPSSLVFNTAARTVQTGQCSNKIEIQSQDTLGRQPPRLPQPLSCSSPATPHRNLLHRSKLHRNLGQSLVRFDFIGQCLRRLLRRC